MDEHCHFVFRNGKAINCILPIILHLQIIGIIKEEFLFKRFMISETPFTLNAAKRFKVDNY